MRSEPDEGSNGDTRRSQLIGALGAITEWYDFSLYVYLAPVYGRVFFPGDDPTEQLLAALAVFAVAYLARPIGAAFFGHLGDRVGRRSSLTTSAIIIAVALIVNTVLPSEAAIGIAAPILLILVRLASGFAVGGEYSGVLVFLLESSNDRNRGLVSSWAPVVSGIGVLLAVGVSALVTALTTTAELDSWGWRIPVGIGALLAIGIFLARRQMTETDAFEQMKERGEISDEPMHELFRTARRPLAIAFALSAIGSAAYYLNVTYVPTFLTNFEQIDAGDALRWSTIASVAMLVTTPLFGMAADRFGRRPSLLMISIALAVATPLLFEAFRDAGVAMSVSIASVLAVLAGAWVAVSASTIPEQFPASIRFSGIAIGYNVAVAVFGGFTPLVATWLVDATGPVTMALLTVSWLAVAGVVVVWLMPETARRPI